MFSKKKKKSFFPYFKIIFRDELRISYKRFFAHFFLIEFLSINLYFRIIFWSSLYRVSHSQ